eukprot:11228305-Lingulodinium_polyedra.AAC.1
MQESSGSRPPCRGEHSKRVAPRARHPTRQPITVPDPDPRGAAMPRRATARKSPRHPSTSSRRRRIQGRRLNAAARSAPCRAGGSNVPGGAPGPSAPAWGLPAAVALRLAVGHRPRVRHVRGAARGGATPRPEEARTAARPGVAPATRRSGGWARLTTNAPATTDHQRHERCVRRRFGSGPEAARFRKRFRGGSEAVPRRLGSGSEAIPRWCGSGAVPRRCGSGAFPKQV